MKPLLYLTIALGFLSPGILADDAESEARETQATGNETDLVDLSGWDDPAINRMVDFTLLGEALADGDASSVADVAMQLAEAERVLYRSHAKVTSTRLFRIAVKMAQNSDDQQTLARIHKAVEASGNGELAAELAAADALGGASRAAVIPPEITVDADQDLIAEAQEVSIQVEIAENTGDAQSLSELRKVVAASEFPDDVADWLNALIDRADKSVGKGSDDARALTLLADASRWGGFSPPTISIPTPSFVRRPSESNLGGPSGLVPDNRRNRRNRGFNSGGYQPAQPRPHRRFQPPKYRNGSRRGGKNLGNFNINAYRQNRLGY